MAPLVKPAPRPCPRRRRRATHRRTHETLDTRGLAPSPTGDGFERQVCTLDRKVLCDDDVRFGHTNPHESEAFVRALECAGVRGWSATPLPHASPNAVRGDFVKVFERLHGRRLRCAFVPATPTHARRFRR